MTTQPNTRNASISNPTTNSFATLAPKLDLDMDGNTGSVCQTPATPSPSHTTLWLPPVPAGIKFSKRPTKGSTHVATALPGKHPCKGSEDSVQGPTKYASTKVTTTFLTANQLTTTSQSCNPHATPNMSANAALALLLWMPLYLTLPTLQPTALRNVPLARIALPVQIPALPTTPAHPPGTLHPVVALTSPLSTPTLLASSPGLPTTKILPATNSPLHFDILYKLDPNTYQNRPATPPGLQLVPQPRGSYPLVGGMTDRKLRRNMDHNTIWVWEEHQEDYILAYLASDRAEEDSTHKAVLICHLLNSNFNSPNLVIGASSPILLHHPDGVKPASRSSSQAYAGTCSAPSLLAGFGLRQALPSLSTALTPSPPPSSCPSLASHWVPQLMMQPLLPPLSLRPPSPLRTSLTPSSTPSEPGHSPSLRMATSSPSSTSMATPPLKTHTSLSSESNASRPSREVGEEAAIEAHPSKAKLEDTNPPTQAFFQ
ncbi:hypothetical protein B0H34DRAFT_797096 [Crassisporium funariophilum]|nr:hypothetical protein B0H34DRAFT_797096 [Crassisporium funariophilum]